MTYSKLGNDLQLNIAMVLTYQEARFSNTFFPPTLLFSRSVLPAIRRQCLGQGQYPEPLKTGTREHKTQQ